MRERRMFLSTLEMSMPSINMLPDVSGVVARRDRENVVLPEPVRPTIAVWVPPGSFAVTFVKAAGDVGV